MGDKDEIAEIFSQKLGAYKTPVNPAVWKNVASQLSTPALAGTSGGLSVLSKWLIAVGIFAGVATTGIILLSPKKELPVLAKFVSGNKNPINNDEEITETSPAEVTTNTNIEYTIPIPTVVSVPDEVEMEVREPAKVEEQPKRISEAIDKRERVKEEVITEETEVEVVAEPEPADEIAKRKNVVEEETTVKTEEEAYFIEQYTNVFSPNGDGINDEFYLVSRGLSDYSIVILNRQNQVVFTSNDPDFRWNGENQYGDSVPEGEYVYYFSATDRNGNVVQKYNQLTIKR